MIIKKPIRHKIILVTKFDFYYAIIYDNGGGDTAL